MNEKIKSLEQNMQQRIVGKPDLIAAVITTLLAGGHLLLEDVPGVGKTSLAKALADSLSLSFARIQCTPDTTPSDITGLSVYNPADRAFQIVPGPVVNCIVLADELNRTSPRTQSALLEVMEEHRVTIDGKPIPVPEPFMVRLSVGYPDPEAEEDMARRFLEGLLHSETRPVLTARDIAQMKDEVRKVTIHESLRSYCVKIVESTRTKPEISCGASPRALLAMLRYAQALAFMDNRAYCIPEDIAEAAARTLPHRLILTAGARLSRVTKEEMVRTILSQVKVP